MKAFILAADVEDGLLMNGPLCLDRAPLIETQITSLLMQGILLDNITLVIEALVAKTDSIKQQLLNLGIKLLAVDSKGTRSSNTFLQVLRSIEAPVDVVFLNGDTYISPEDLEALTSERNEPSILIEKRYNRNALGIYIDEKSGDCFVNKPPNHAPRIPWKCFSGALYLPKDMIQKMPNEASEDLSYLEFLLQDSNIKYRTCYRINKDFTKYLNQNSSNLVGGSFAKLKDASLVIKSADETGALKLQNEINWLISLNPVQKEHFSEVLDHRISSSNVQYSMPYYGYPSMRYCILNSIMKPSEIANKLDTVLQYLEDNFYQANLSHLTDWIQSRHFDRFDERLTVTLQNSVMAEILALEDVIINGKKYESLLSLVNRIKSNDQLLKRVQPAKTVMIHGDLHLQNILVDPNGDDFMLVDPRGELRGADVFYDLGKIWHSVNGLYDLIHTDISTLSRDLEKKNSFNLSRGPSFILLRYQELKKAFYNILHNRFKLIDRDWYLKMLFNEAMHFSTLVNFHLKGDGDEQRAKILYLTAIILCDNLIKYFEDNK